MMTEMIDSPSEHAVSEPKRTRNAAPSEGREALVKDWLKRIERSQAKWAPAFKRMKDCRQIAREGAPAEWVKADRYSVPIVTRYINQTVAQLYAKNPRVRATPKKKLMYQLWDGKPESVMQAMQAVGMPPVDPLTGMPLPDPNAAALLEEVQTAVAEAQRVEKLGKTMEILFDYYTSEQSGGFKTHMKALVRRAKVNGVAWVKLAFQRELQKLPEISAQIDDTTNQIASIERLGQQVEDGRDDTGAKAEALRLQLADLQAKEEIVVREGPVFDWPAPEQIIVDENCVHLKTLRGAGFVAQQFDKTPEEIEQIYGVDVRGSYTRYEANGTERARIYEVQDRDSGQVFVVCEGYDDFVKEPAEPDVRIERFWTLFPLVFNEADGEEIYPPSDVWHMRHLQFEYNRAREALREHRIAAAPLYATPSGALDETDYRKLTDGVPHSVLRIKMLSPGQKAADLVSAVPKASIDQNLYETGSIFDDMLRAVGMQEASIGTTGGGTATESSIAEQSRSASLAENVDDLDTLLSQVAQAMGQIMLLELSRDTVVEIAGPGAAWPDLPQSRQQIVKDLELDIMAGSSGRPNVAATLANLERAVPLLLQMPGMNPRPLQKKFADLLEIDVDEMLAQELPSITALNAMSSRPPPPNNLPQDQGAAGADNAPRPDGESGPQPAYPNEADPASQAGLAIGV